MTDKKPSVLFVCKRNGGKSQIAAGLAKLHAGEDLIVGSAGTEPGDSLNQKSVDALDEVGVDITNESPKLATPELVNSYDLVVILGDQAKLPDADPSKTQTWLTDEPSERGIEGMERMRLVRDDIDARIKELLSDLDL